ncbi:hypothetical protein AERO9AM_10271 [Aeromicrobium sp. 9AM]|nr:hypothetical protein AERO9AM_10271 [Aeromicrobium sp. 9AM]
MRQQFGDSNDVALYELILPAFVYLQVTYSNRHAPPCCALEQLLGTYRLPHPLSPYVLAGLDARLATKGTAKRGSRGHLVSVTTAKRKGSDSPGHAPVLRCARSAPQSASIVA